MNSVNMQGLSLAVLLLSVSGQAMGEKGLLFNSAGSVWRTSNGECWNTTYRHRETHGTGCFDEPKMVVVKEGDADGDGVVDSKDQCPGTATGIEVDAIGCPMDSDGDGVADYRDQCPNTPPGSTIDAVGCAVKIVLNNILFELNSDRLDLASLAALEQVAETLKVRTDIQSLEVIGHTDSSGDAQYNQALSEKRAKAVADFLASQGIEASKISSRGMGESDPVADNDTAEGREKNRRVELNMK